MNWFQKLSFRSKILTIVAMASFLCALISITGFLYFDKKQLVNGMINKQRTIHTQLDAVTSFVATQGGLHSAVEEIKQKYNSSNEISDRDKEKLMNQVPIVSAMKIGKENQNRDHYKFRVYSDEPRRKENLANAKELEVLNKFKKDPSLKEFIVSDGVEVTMFRPVRLSAEKGCLTCHGNPTTSPWGNGKDILGYPMENWKDGKLHGVFAISQNIEEVAMASTAEYFISPASILILAIVLGAFLSLLFAALIARGPIGEMNRVVEELEKSQAEVTQASQQSASTASKLSESSTRQASTLQQTVTAIGEISAMVKQNAETASRANDIVGTNKEAADEGAQSVHDMEKAIEDIRLANEQTLLQMETSNEEFSDIVKIIREIGEKTNVINDIVTQTKLLSFNASVEAARAGEHGKGFAVVASEVGNLASMSGQAAKEINGMLLSSIEKVNELVKQTTERMEHLAGLGKDKIGVGLKTSQRCSKALSRIEENAHTVAILIGEITNASKEQAIGVQEINNAIAEMDKMTQQNSGMAQQSSTQAVQLNAEARNLSTSVNALIQWVRGMDDDEAEAFERRA